MHVPLAQARLAREYAARYGADCTVAIGGGSTIGLAKAIALESALPVIAVPTTYSGSEMTPIYGLTDAGLKRTGRDPRVLPRTILYDPELSLALPASVSVTSGMNAIAHAAEGLYASDSNPVSQWMSREGIAAFGRSLPVIAAAGHPMDESRREARSDALYGAWLCGAVLGSVTAGLHHKLCHTLGGTFNLPHAEVHTVVLPHALAYNAPAAPEAMAAIAQAWVPGMAMPRSPCSNSLRSWVRLHRCANWDCRLRISITPANWHFTTNIRIRARSNATASASFWRTHSKASHRPRDLPRAPRGPPCPRRTLRLVQYP